MNLCSLEIHDLNALTPDLYLGAEGTWSGLSLSTNLPVTVTGTVIGIRDCMWSLVTIQQADGDIYRIRIV